MKNDSTAKQDVESYDWIKRRAHTMCLCIRERVSNKNTCGPSNV